MGTQIIIIVSTLIVFVLLGFMMNNSIKKYESNKSKIRQKKKGRSKYMPEVKKLGR